MNENRINAIKAYFGKQLLRCKEQQQTLSSDSRSDEAVFSRIEMNVYDIFNTIFATALKLHATDEDKVKDFFNLKTEQIPQAWKSSLQAAEEHENFEKAYIERIKLDKIFQIKNAFQELWEASYD